MYKNGECLVADEKKEPQEMRASYDLEKQLKEIYLGNFQRLARFAGTIDKYGNDSDDIVHDAFVKAWKHLDSFNALNGNLRAWINTIVMREAINNYRRRKKGFNVMQTLQRNYEGNEKSNLHSPCLESSLLEEIEKLPEKFKEVFKLYTQEHSYEEISNCVGIPVGTVKSRIFRSKKILQKKCKGILSQYNLSRNCFY